MTERDTRVFYRAVANFSNLRRELRKIREDIAKTQAAEKAYNTASAKDRAAATKASTARAKALTTEAQTLRTLGTRLTSYATRLKASTVATRSANKAINAQNRALKTNAANLTAAALAAENYAKAQRSIARSTGPSSTAFRDLQKEVRALRDAEKAQVNHTEAVRKHKREIDRSHISNVRFVKGIGDVNRKTGEVVRTIEDGASKVSIWRRGWDRARLAIKRFGDDGRRLPPIIRNIERGSSRLHRSLRRLGDWRPRLVPPFIALIPLIGAVIAAINPLVALFGALGGAAIGLAGQIGSLSGAFLALPGILSGVAAGIASVIASMGGIGNVFKTYSAMQKATNSAGSGESQADRADRLARAEWNLAKTQRSVQKAQERLNEARQEALQDLIDLRLEVSRADMTEERAIANLRQAQEAYWNVMADPASTLGDKLDAAVAIKEAEADLEDVRKKNIENQKALTQAEQKGIDSSEKVIDAQERLTDAIYAQKDAQKALRDQESGGSGAVQAINEYQKALDELSPSARAFVLGVIAMEEQWKSFRREMQETFFSQFVDDVSRLPRLIQTLGNFLRPAAASMGRFVSSFLQLMDSDAWRRDLTTIGEQNGVVIKNLGDGFLALATALKDIIIAAGPFTEWMTNGFARGAENFSKFVADARQTGRLASWLEKVEERLRKWWEIVKNIGATIFNYSAAASGFGDWISDGLLEMTENWRKASEAAREPGSEFQQWLENIKPLLQEVDGLLGDFFSWFAREASEVGNIESMTDLVKLIRDDLGPALGRLLDTLAETEIDEKLVTALSSILESIDTILEKGGSAGFEAFFDVVTGAFDAVAQAISIIPEPILDGLLTLFGIIAGVAFFAKFTGITLLLGKIPTFVSGAKNLFGWLKKIDALKFAKIGGLVALAALGTKNTVENNEVLGSTFNAIDGTPEEKQEALNRFTKNGAGLKAVTGPNSASVGLGMPQGFMNLGGISDVLGFLGSLPGGGVFKEWQTEFDGFLEGVTQSYFEWAIPFFADVNTNWGDFSRDWEGFWGTDLPKGFEDGWNGITTWFDTNVGANFERGWKGISDFFTKTIPTFFEDVGRNFRNGWHAVVKAMEGVWNNIRNAFAGPVNWVITHVYNRGLRSFWNDVVKNLNLPRGLNLPELPTIGTPKASSGAGGGFFVARKEGGILPGWSPGSDIHTFTSPTGGTLKLSGGEAVMRPEFTKAVGGKRGVDELNRKARNGQAFRSGGVINFGGDVMSSIGSTFNKFVGGIVGFFSDPLGTITKTLNGIISPLLPQIPGGRWGDVLEHIPGKIVSGLGNLFKSNYSGDPVGGGAPANALGWQAMWRIIQGKFPRARLHSGYRNPIQNAAIGGVPGSYHTQGRAIDVTPSMEIFNWLRQNFPNSRELIYSPANQRQLRNGKNFFWGEPVRSDHYDHVHWAMRRGGVIPGLYDNGGWLPNGGLAVNASGKPEAVLDPMESRALKALLSGSGISGGLPAFGASAVNTSAQAGTKIVDNSVNIDKVEINNPVPEKLSTSLPKSIRRIGYMNLARSDASV